eukprot:CAMPEP_0206447038 /NCGR_PEP_ID=MMETSP0324_2-20121206/16526_1 /ASSEMBLY_ACC=CAM_ASM_000836 /TAXON_ID=2866 /ORGANISM="Crypthecodinium cohnii, Strain Seligo" /LENGTH=306 /DNA_ID=CAMNT_0053915689 /DNA_START=40 /DNA_END=960 /DNA_ORIENTATION=+
MAPKAATKWGCAGVLGALSIGGFALFGVALVERIRLDPFWVTMLCTTTGKYSSGKTLTVPTITAADLNLDENDPATVYIVGNYTAAATIYDFYGWTQKECVNENQVDVNTKSYKNGTVYVEYPDGAGGTYLLALGESWIPEVDIPMEETSNFKSWNSFSINGSVVYWASTQASVTVISQFHTETTSSASIFGLEGSTVKLSERWCGYKANFLTNAIGENVCEDSYEELVVPEIDEAVPPDEMKGTKKDIEASEFKRDLICGLAMAVGLLIGFGCLITAIILIRRAVRGAQAAEAGGKAVETDDVKV